MNSVKLKPREEMVLRLRREGLSYRIIAEKMLCTIGRVRWIEKKANEKLANLRQ